MRSNKMIHPLANSFIITSIVIIADIFTSGKKLLTKYFIIFFLVLGMGYTYRAHADVNSSNILTEYHVGFHNIEYLISPNDPDYVDPRLPVWKKFMLHIKFAKSNYDEAEDYVWWHISDKYDDKEKAKLCFEAVLCGGLPIHPLGKAIGITLLLFKEYGLDCIDRYAYVNHLLNKAAYHVEMYEFYNEFEDGGMDDVCEKGYVVIHNHVDEEDQN